jgi:hypothetical protein
VEDDSMVESSASEVAEEEREQKTSTARIIEEQRQYVDTHRGTWLNHRDSFMDNFWRESGENAGTYEQVSSLDAIPLFAINRMKSWIVSYTASLFYRGFSAELGSDDVYGLTDPVAPLGKLVKRVLDRFYNTIPFARMTEAAFTACLLYPHGAFYLKHDPRERRPVDQLVAEFMPPWECVWDRFASSVEEARYLGRSWAVSMEDAEQVFGVDHELVEKHLIIKPDVLRHGMANATYRIGADCSYVRLLDLYYPRKKNADGSFGRRCLYVLDSNLSVVAVVREEAVAWRDGDGRPVIPIEPIVLTSVPEHPLWGVPNAATIYALERENNAYAAWLAQAMKMEALRKLFLDRSLLTDEGAENIVNPSDHAVVDVKPGALSNGPGRIASFMQSAPAPTNGLALRQFIESMFEAVSGTAPVSRGQPTQYIPATESANLAAYSETTLGMIRSKMDRAVAGLGQRYLHALAHVMALGGANHLPVRIKDDIEELPAAQLVLRWTIRIVDGANTPAKTEGQKRDSLQLMPLLMQIAIAATNLQAPPETKAAMKAIWEDVVDRFGLTETLSWKTIAADASKAEPEMGMESEVAGPVQAEAPPEPAAPPVPPSGLTMEQSSAIDSDAAAEADLRGAFTE